MPVRTRRKHSDPPPLPARRLAAFCVHLLTASGTVVALFALISAVEAKWTAMFLWLGVALALDGVDGLLARRLKVAELLPRWSGEVLDLVVDYLNYVLVPAFAIATGGFFPPLIALPAAAAILVSGAIYFSDREMKTADSYFRGFPALWNMVAFYLFLLRPDAAVALIVVVVFVALTFAPIHIVHPLRVKRFARLNLVLLVVWALLGALALYHELGPPAFVSIALVALGLYFLMAGFIRRAGRKA